MNSANSETEKEEGGAEEEEEEEEDKDEVNSANSEKPTARTLIHLQNFKDL